MEAVTPRPLPSADQPAAVSRLVVRTVSEYTGRGPTKVRAYISGDIVAVVMRDTLTKAERSLIDSGQGDLVVQIRRAFQQTMKPDFVPGIEAITGRTVMAFLSDHQIDPDVAVETFVLEPQERPVAA